MANIKKSISRILLFCIPLLAVSCQDEIVTYPDVSECLSYAAGGSVSHESETNPTLISDWESVTKIFLNTGSSVTAPWCEGCSSSLPSKFRRDISKSRGWTMLFHTFKRLHNSEGQNYMVFYNFFSGRLKVFYYSFNPSPANNTLWCLSGPDNSYSRLLNQPGYISSVASQAPDNSANYLQFPNLSFSPTSGSPVGAGWVGFEFNIGQYTDDLPDDSFIIKAVNKKYTISYVSSTGSKQRYGGTISKIAPNYSGTTLVGELFDCNIDFSEREARNFINTKKNSVQFDSDQILSGLESLASGNVSAAINQRISTIFGSGSAILTNNTATSDMRLTTEDAYESIFSIDINSNVPYISFNLKKIIGCQNNDVEEVSGYGAYGNASIVVPNSAKDRVPSAPVMTGLGNWTLQDSITAYWDLVSMSTDTEFVDEGADWMVSGKFAVPRMVGYDIDVVVNPFIKPYIKSKETSVRFAAYSDGPHLPFESFNLRESFFETLYSDSIKSIYDMPPAGSMASISALYPCGKDETAPDNGEPVYFKWELPSYQIVATVAVKMTVDYNDNVFDVVDYRTYPVRNVERSSLSIPSTGIALQKGNAWFINMSPSE